MCLRAYNAGPGSLNPRMNRANGSGDGPGGVTHSSRLNVRTRDQSTARARQRGSTD
jgi:hypothetical protein